MDTHVPDIFDRMAKLIEEDKFEFLVALKEHKIWEDVRDAAVDDAIDRGDVVTRRDHEEEIEKLENEIAEAPDFNADAERLHDAICEGRRQDAIDILNDIDDGQYRSVREMRNLFPDRVPA